MPAQSSFSQAGFGSVDAVRREAEGLAAKAAEGGRKVCGWLGAGSPVELVEAAGFVPLELSAANVRDTPLADEYMEDLFDPVVRGVFERLLRGELAFLSAIVLPRSGDSVHRFYYYLCELRRIGIAHIPETILFGGLQAPGAPSEQYSADRLPEIVAKLTVLRRAGPGDADIPAALAASAQRRNVLVDFTRRRLSGDLAVTGGEALAFHAAARMLPRSVFTSRARALLRAATPITAGDRPRIVIAGSPHDDDGLHCAIEAAGGIVVGDFHAAGDLAIGSAPGRDLASLLSHYRNQWTPRSFGDPAARIADFARNVRADAVVFSFFPIEEALTWDYPEQVKALEAQGVATLRLQDQKRPYDGAAAQRPLAELLARLKEQRK